MIIKARTKHSKLKREKKTSRKHKTKISTQEYPFQVLKNKAQKIKYMLLTTPERTKNQFPVKSKAETTRKTNSKFST